MDLNKIPLFAALAKRMDWLNQRQRVLAENVANANTPGYKPNDLKEQSFRDLLKGVAPGGKLAASATDARHISAGAAAPPGGASKVQKDKENYEVSPTGNAVVLEDQMMKVAETQLDYQIVTSVYKKHLGMLKLALGRNPNG